MWILLAQLAQPAHAQAVRALPEGATAVSVGLCGRSDGCVDEWAALRTRHGAQGLPLMELQVVLAHQRQGPREALERALARIDESGPDDADINEQIEAIQGALSAWSALSETVDGAVLAGLNLRLAEAYLRQGDAVQADAALRRAASGSGGQTWNLPELSETTLARYLDRVAATEPASLYITADRAGTRVFVDGKAVGTAPITVAVLSGWHRVTVERPGRPGAWVAELSVQAGRTATIDAAAGSLDGAASLEARLVAGMRGQEVDSETLATVTDWARSEGLRWVRFESLAPPSESGELEVIAESGRRFTMRTAWLDVAAGRLSTDPPSGAVLVQGSGRERLRVGATLGWLHAGSRDPADPSPREHVSFEVSLMTPMAHQWGLEGRVGVLRASRPYYLYEGWVDPQIYPVSLGLRWAPLAGGITAGGPYAGAAAVAHVPYALGGEARLGLDLAPTHRWRLTLELRGGGTGKGAHGAAVVGLARR